VEAARDVAYTYVVVAFLESVDLDRLGREIHALHSWVRSVGRRARAIAALPRLR
jgi:hypothetical protein